MDEEIVLHAYYGILFSFKKKKNSAVCETWMYFHDIILSDKSQSHKRQILHNSTYMNEFSKIVKFIESESGMVVSRDWREKDLGLLIYEQKFSFRQDELFSDIYTTLFLK